MSNINKKRLIFHFYLPNDWENYKIIKVHLECLSIYAKYFDDAHFVISVDDVNDCGFALDFECQILKQCLFKNVRFEITKNDNFRESRTLYDKIISNLGEYDGLTFFAHSKGVGNEKYSVVDMERLYSWVIGLYFFSLNFVDDVDCLLRGLYTYTYGPFKTYSDICYNKYNWYYSGTFFWINDCKVESYLIKNRIELPKLYDRFYSERLLGEIFEFDDILDDTSKNCSSGGYLTGDSINYYDNIDQYIGMLHDNETISNFYNFRENILKRCRIK